MKPSRQTSSSHAAKASRPERQTPAELRDLQRLMARAVMRPLADNGRMRTEWSDGGATRKVAAGFIKPNDRQTSFERLEIYNRQYWFRVFDCLAEDFCGLRALVGAQCFRNLAIAYLANHPSTSFTLRDLGRRFPEFVRAQPRWTAPREELAFDMARLEWAHIEAFDSEAKTPVSAVDLHGRDASKIRLRLQPHLTLLELGWPFDDYLIAMRENSRLRGEASNAVEESAAPRLPRKPPVPKREAVFLAVHRHQNMVYYKRLEEAQFELLTALGRGVALSRALAKVASLGNLPVREWFHDWSALGWFWLKTGKAKTEPLSQGLPPSQAGGSIIASPAPVKASRG